MWNEGETSEEIERKQERRVKEIFLSFIHFGFCFLNYFPLHPHDNSNIIHIISLLNMQNERFLFRERKSDVLSYPVDDLQFVTIIKDVIFPAFKSLWESCCCQRRASQKRTIFNSCDAIWDGD